jgi:hypothetical protein
VSAHGETKLPTLNSVSATAQTKGQAKLVAIVSSNNGEPTTVVFSYGKTLSYELTRPDGTRTLDANAVNQRVEVQLEGLELGVTYYYRVEAKNSEGTASVSGEFLEDLPPVARPDRRHVPDLKPVDIPVLQNDSDPDNDAVPNSDPPFISGIRRNPSNGTVAIVVVEGKQMITYQPDVGFKGTDSFEYEIKDKGGRTAAAVVTIANSAPIARPDNAKTSAGSPVSIPVLRNDSDPDKDHKISIKSVAKPSHGTARRSGERIIYTPDGGFRGQDTFAYTIEDQFGVTAKATVTIFDPGRAISGPLGAILTGKDGKKAGYLRLQTSKSGSFSGSLDVGTKHYRLVGKIGADGKFRGSAVDDDGDRIQVELNVAIDGDQVMVTGDIGDGEWALSTAYNPLTSTSRREMEGRYTVELPSPGNTSPAEGEGETVFSPEGTGWMSVKLDESGTARLKGKAGDGRAFSTKAYVGGTADAPTLSFYATPESSILSGTLNIGETITGDVYWFREETDADYYPEGFEVTVGANGRRYEKPEEEKRALEVGGESSERMTITVSGGEIPGFSRELRLSEDDDVRVVREGLDELQLDFDRKSGIFKGKFRILNDLNRRAKITGVLLQGESRGSGVFLGVEKSGKVELTVGSGSSTPTTPDTGSVVTP